MMTKRSQHQVKPTAPNNRPTPWGLLLLTAAMLLLILYSGLHFKGSSTANDVTWLGDQNGIRFDRQGIAYAKTIAPSFNRMAHGNIPFSIELAIKSLEASDDGRFRFLLLLHGGDDTEQLVVGQWRSWLVIMNGDDYDATRRRARIAVNALLPEKEHFVTITSGEDGTAIFIDGQLTERKGDLRLKIPVATKQMQLVLGNSIYGRHPWAGEIYGLAYYDRVMSEPDISDHFQLWSRKRTFAFTQPQNPAGLYLFNEGIGDRVGDHAEGKHDLAIPENMAILTKEFLAAPFGNEKYNVSHFQDMAINIAGFIPMGFLLGALLWQANYRDVIKQLLLVMLACGSISLMIELAQAWIPSRSSQMLDLILNTLGAGTGVICHSVYRNYFAATPPNGPPSEK